MAVFSASIYVCQHHAERIGQVRESFVKSCGQLPTNKYFSLVLGMISFSMDIISPVLRLSYAPSEREIN
jgi:hypothetical protein